MTIIVDTARLNIIGNTIPNQVRLLKSIWVEHNRVDVWETSDTKIIVNFFFTKCIHDVLYNLDRCASRLVDPNVHTDMFFHRGYQRIIARLRPPLDAFLKTLDIRGLYLCGWSLGVALAILYGFLTAQQPTRSFHVDVLVIGAPVSLGTEAFNMAVNTSVGLRIRNFVQPGDPTASALDSIPPNGSSYVRNEAITVYIDVFSLDTLFLHLATRITAGHDRYTGPINIISAFLLRHRLTHYLPAIRTQLSIPQGPVPQYYNDMCLPCALPRVFPLP